MIQQPFIDDRIIEVPVVDRMPDLLSRPFDMVGVVDHLLTLMLRAESGTLYSNLRADGGKWHVQGWPREATGLDEISAIIEEKGRFRAMLARFGHHYMGGQLYGGYAERTLLHRGHKCSIIIHMGNDSWRGYWLRAYSRGVSIT